MKHAYTLMISLFSLVFAALCAATLVPTAAFADAPAEQDLRCLSLAIYFEARGESEIGKLAVGSVVMNRVKSKRFPNTVCGVVKQGGEKPPCQFSWWCDGKSDRPRDKKAWQVSSHAAQEILQRRAKDPTRGALYFHNTSVNPKWSLHRLGRVGSHIFYR